MNNKILLIVLVILLGVYGAYEWMGGDARSTFDPQLVKVDTARVTQIEIAVKADSMQPFTLEKAAGQWYVVKGDKRYPADAAAVGELLGNLLSLRATHIAAKSASEWPNFELGEAQANRIAIFEGKKKTAEIFAGKFDVDPQAQRFKSYFRTANGDEVYAVEGMAGMMLGNGYQHYRDKRALEFEIQPVERIQVDGEGAYTVEKTTNGWLLDQQVPIDSSRVQNFLMNLRRLSGDAFAEDFDPQANQGKLYKTLTLSGKSMPEPIVVKCWRDTSWVKPYVIQTSHFPMSFFASDSLRLYKRIFKPVQEW